MSREIKFRVWDANLKRWLIDLTIQNGHTSFSWQGPADCDGKNLVWQQFTNLFDKNGIEIYEGDIIKLDRNKHSVFVVDFGSYKDQEDYGHTGFGLRRGSKKDRLFGFGDDFDGEVNKTCEIIGNIFENPDLIK